MKMNDLTPIRLAFVVIVSGFAGFIAPILTRWEVRRLWTRLHFVPGAAEHMPLTEVYEPLQFFVKLLGRLECAAYAASCLMGVPEAIAVVLVLKATPHLKEWSEKGALGRGMFNIWLIGNLMNVILSVLIAAIASVLAGTCVWGPCRYSWCVWLLERV